MLRTGLFAFGGLLLLWGLIDASMDRSFLGPTIPGVILLLALIAERYVYKPIRDDIPDPEWQRTQEQFVDPKSGRTVAVYFHPRTGERRYVASRADDAAAQGGGGNTGGAGKA
jgi:hypothetical protein